MRRLSLILLLACYSAGAGAEVVNVEFKFTPFVGDPTKSDAVETVAGTASVFINDLPIAEQPVGQQEVPVLFDDREIAPSDPTTFEKIKGDEAQMCVSMALFGVYPPQIAVVHAPSGAWEVAY